MKKPIKGITIIEVLIGSAFLAVIVGSILGVFTTFHRYYKDGIALVNSQSTARIVINKIAGPLRHGSFFSILLDGDELVINMTGPAVDEFGPNVTYRFENNAMKKNGNTFAVNIVKIPGADVFQEIEADERVGINFGVRNVGVSGNFKEVRFSTVMKLRN